MQKKLVKLEIFSVQTGDINKCISTLRKISLIAIIDCQCGDQKLDLIASLAAFPLLDTSRLMG